MKTYEEVTATALKTYEEVRATALKTYEEVTATALLAGLRADFAASITKNKES